MSTTSATAEPIEAARALRPLIEAYADEGESTTTMPRPVVDALTQAGLFRILLPAEYGSEHDAVTAVRVVEEISRADPSTGWSYMANIAGAAILYAFVGDAGAKAFVSGDDEFIMAGMVGKPGVGRAVDGGYVVSGHFQFGSGCGHATWMSGGAIIGENDPPTFIGFALPASSVEFKGNWDVLGLRGTGSYDYVVTEQFVPEEFTFLFDRQKSVAQRGHPSLRIGLRPLAACGHLGVSVGTAARALEEIALISAGRQRPGSAVMSEQQLFLNEFAIHESNLQSVRAYGYDALADITATVAAGGSPTAVQQERVKQATTMSVRVASAVVQFAYTWSGSAGYRQPHVLGRLLRDVFGQTQHQIIDPDTLTVAGRELLADYRASAEAARAARRA